MPLFDIVSYFNQKIISVILYNPRSWNGWVMNKT